MANRVCPVCGNPEIGDYRHQHLTCNRCGCDLGIFNLIDEERSRSRLSLRWLSIGSLCVLLIALLVTHKITAGKLQTVISEKDDEIACQAEKISTLKKDIDSLNEVIVNDQPVQLGGFVYTVRQGDSFCGISHKFYGTEKYCEDIASDNGLSITSHLSIGQQLRIKSH